MALRRTLALAVVLTCSSPVPAMAAEPADLQALERTWHVCLQEAYVHQPAAQSRVGNSRNALDECKPHEDAYVAALMAARPDDPDMLMGSWARTWAAYVAYVADPVKAWIDALRR